MYYVTGGEIDAANGSFATGEIYSVYRPLYPIFLKDCFELILLKLEPPRSGDVGIY